MGRVEVGDHLLVQRFGAMPRDGPKGTEYEVQTVEVVGEEDGHEVLTLTVKDVR